jgi:hypothetical protein
MLNQARTTPDLSDLEPERMATVKGLLLPMTLL